MKNKTKSSALAISVLACLAAAPAHAGLFGSSLGGDIAKESTQMAKWIIQADQMMEQINLLRDGWKSDVDGSWKPDEDVPLTWQEVVKMQEAAEGSSSSSVYQEQLTKYEEFVKTLDESMTQEEDSFDGGRAARTYKMNQREAKIAFAAAETAYDTIKRRTKNLKDLEAKIGTIPGGVRAAVDLNSRIQLESSYIQTELARLSAIHQRLMAAQLNQDTQGMAQQREFLISFDEYQKQKGQQPNQQQGDQEP